MADYIPLLAQADPSRFGLTLADLDAQGNSLAGLAVLDLFTTRLGACRRMGQRYGSA